MIGPTSPRKAWLMIGMVVLVLHLALLRSVPLALGSAKFDRSPLTFTVHTLAVDSNETPTKVKLQPKVPKKTPLNTAAKPAATAPPQASTLPLAAGGSEAPLPVAASTDTAPTTSLASTTSVAQASSEVKPPKQAFQPANAKVSAEALPGSIKLLYKVKSNKFPYHLNAELLWTRQEDHYAANFRVGVLGQYRVQTSRGAVNAAGLLPERFSDKYRSEVAAHFNWPQGKVTFSANTPDVLLQAGAQDRLSVLIQLAAMLASAPAQRAPGTTITLQTIGPRDADAWLFTVGEVENLEMPSEPVSTVRAIKMTRKPRQMYDQTMELWMAPTLNYLPARIRLTEANDDFVDQMWFATAAENP